MATLTFFGWWRPPGSAAISSSTTTAGRLSASVQLTARDLDNTSDAATRTVSYDLFGPGDVKGLGPGAIVHTYPSPGARNVEIEKAVYAELGAPDLPWRYTLAQPQGRVLRPWMVLLVGTTTEIEVLGQTVRLQPSVLDAHSLNQSARCAHVEQDQNLRVVGRLLSPRPLEPDRDHVAVIVPAYTATGASSWATPAAAPVELPLLYDWTFHTRAGGDFAALARRLKLRTPEADFGTVSVGYTPLPNASAMRVGGALVATTPEPATLPHDVRTDLAELTAPLGDPAHPVLGLPDYAAPWPPSPAPPPPPGWRDQLRADYRVRAVAGLGAEAGIANQELLAREAGRVAGAYEEAAARLRQMMLGLLASRSLWKRRVSTDPTRRLGMLGPALRDVLSDAGPVAEVMEHPDRAFERTLFSSAAQRAARVRGAPDASDPPAAPAAAGIGAALSQSAAAPPRRVRSDPGTLHTDTFARATNRAALDDVLVRAAPDPRRLRPTAARLADALDRRDLDPDTVSVLNRQLGTVVDKLGGGQAVPILPLLALVDAGARPSRERLRVLAAALDAEPDSDDLAALGVMVGRRPGQPVAVALDIDRAGMQIATAFDPTPPRPPLVDRVLEGISDAVASVDADPTELVELTPDLDLPAWRFLRDNLAEWLLPGAGTLSEDTVLGLTTNPAFVDAFLLGLNAQVVAELRFRNYPLIAGWTPVRTFWDRANPATQGTDDDIVEVSTWPADSTFGATSHQTPSAASADLVLLFNTPLFREYPGTLVYLAPAQRTAGALDWSKPPDFDLRQYPAFLGRISPDQTFFGFDLDPALGVERWVVLEETVNGRRFFNAAQLQSSATSGGEFARDMVSAPRRVAIRGDVLLGGARP